MELKIKSVFTQKSNLNFIIEIEAFEFDIKQRKNKKLLVKIGQTELLRMTSRIPILINQSSDNKILIIEGVALIIKKEDIVIESKTLTSKKIVITKRKSKNKIRITFKCIKV